MFVRTASTSRAPLAHRGRVSILGGVLAACAALALPAHAGELHGVRDRAPHDAHRASGASGLGNAGTVRLRALQQRAWTQRAREYARRASGASRHGDHAAAVANQATAVAFSEAVGSGSISRLRADLARMRIRNGMPAVVAHEKTVHEARAAAGLHRASGDTEAERREIFAALVGYEALADAHASDGDHASAAKVLKTAYEIGYRTQSSRLPATRARLASARVRLGSDPRQVYGELIADAKRVVARHVQGHRRLAAAAASAEVAFLVRMRDKAVTRE